MLKNGTRVQFKDTGNKELDSITGTIIGVATVNIVNTYIVMMDRFHSRYDYPACTMTESCLDVLQ